VKTLSNRRDHRTGRLGGASTRCGRARPRALQFYFELLEQRAFDYLGISTEEGEALRLKVIILDNQPARSAALYWRPLGRGEFRKHDLTHVARGVYQGTLESVQNDIEYYIAAETAEGKKLIWPITAPEVNQTVVAWAALGQSAPSLAGHRA
jgi:hypothetical protein